MRRVVLPALLVASALAGPATAAERLLDPMFADHAVVQRDRPINVWGRAAPGETVGVEFGAARATAKAGPDGRWHATLPAITAGGPYSLSARAGEQVQRVSDMLAGDVFLCSGQSNMEWPVGAAVNGKDEVARSADPAIRLLTISQRASPGPVETLSQPAEWKLAGPDSTADFSAACFFMAQSLRRAHPELPIGLIDNSWGGSAIEAWLSPSGYRAAGGDPALLALVERYRTDPSGAAVAWGAKWEAWWQAHEKDPAEASPWAEHFRPGPAWRPVPALTNWEDWGEAKLADFNGMMWYRAAIRLTAEQAAQPAMLGLGTVDDVDQTWVNGRRIGATSSANAERLYPLPAGTLHAGDNVVMVNVLDLWGKGGIYGPSEQRAIELGNGERLALASASWLYRPVTEFPDQPPRSPWDAIAGITTIHNGMEVPIGAWGVKGVTWYQGESNAWDGRGYEKLLRALLADWRARWGAELPVAIVQLPDYGAIPSGPVESGWAELRESQRRVASSDPHAALVVTIDVGDPANLHPPAKRPVGDRLALAMEHLAYGAKAAGPQPVAAQRTAKGIAISFRDASGALSAEGAPRQFELCGEAKGSCRSVPAKLAGQAVLLPADRAVTRVRYCWGDAPRCSLRDVALPVTPFELQVN